MKINYIGHACFMLTAKDGTRVITDPYDASVGLDMLSLEAEMITMSHEHHDHNCEDMIVGQPRIVHGPELAAVGSVTARAVRSWHDDAQGEKRGANFIRIFGVDGLKVVHMGDQGCMPDEDVLEAIFGADVMMIPVGGFYTVDAQEAKAIIDITKPRCVIPMHYRTQHCKYSIANIDSFLDVMKSRNVDAVREIEISVNDVPQGMILLEAQGECL